MDIIYTKHVRVRIRERHLSTTQIETTIAQPDRSALSFKGRLLAKKRFGHRTLEVVYKPLPHAVILITAYWVDEGA